MPTARRSRLAPWFLATLVAVLAIAAPVGARQPEHPAPNTPKPAPPAEQATAPTSACTHPCTHVADCPKVTCECSEASGSGVAACDTEETHCCADTETACTRFCEIHQQTWTGRFTAEGATPPSAAPAPAAAPTTAASPAPCDQPCDKAEDCRTMTCQCAQGSAENVAACEAKTHCCAAARIVCEHFCSGKKGKWTGKAADTPPPSDGDGYGGLDEPPDDDPYDDDDDGGGGYLAP